MGDQRVAQRTSDTTQNITKRTTVQRQSDRQPDCQSNRQSDRQSDRAIDSPRATVGMSIELPVATHPMLKLQRQVGNRAVARQIQTKLTVGKPNDTYEQEADRVANTVMRMPDTPNTMVQTIVQRQPDEKKEELVQAKLSIAETTPIVLPQVETQIQSMRGGGQPLPDTTRGFFESRMGYDLSGVRIHADAQAGEVAGHLNAQAFAIGQDVFFNTGRYEPQTHQGKWLLAHELTHTVQQNPSVQQTSTAHRKASTTLSLSPHGVIRRKVVAGGPKAPSSPAQDPGFQAMVKKTKSAAKQQKQHAPAKSKAAESQAAAVAPTNDIGSKAAGKQVGQMDQQQPKAFDRKAFKAALLNKIAATAPKNLKEADEFKESGKVGTIKGELTGQVDSSKQQSGGAIVDKVKGTPDPSGIPAKAVASLPPNAAGVPPSSIGAEQAIPKPKTAAEVSLQAGSQSLDQQMAEADVTENQLKKSNEPDFQAAADTKQQAQKDAVTAPQTYRQREQGVLAQAQSQAVTTAKTQLIGMHGVRAQAQSKTTAAQQQAKAQDEQKRAEVANELQTLYTQTKKATEDRLARLDTEVTQAFDQGATQAQKAFESYVQQQMDAYKDDRYGGFGGGALWLKDKFLGLPNAVNAFYQDGRKLYIVQMDAVLDRVAFLVEKGLNEAKAEITKGKKAIEKKLNDQPEGLRKALQADAQKIQGQFDQLEQTVEAKQDQLLDSLTQKYNEKLQAIDSRIDEMKAANRGLVGMALDAVGGVIKAILELKNMLLGVLAKAAGAIKKIIRDPIGFLGNLVAGVKQGFMNFIGKISEHLQKGLIGWLFGALADAGVQLPESFDLKGIISLVLQILGMTYNFFRARAVTLLGEKVVKTLEMVAEPFKILMTQGPGGLWEYIKDQLSTLKDVVLDGIKSFVTESIIKAGVTWIIGLLNPAGAFIKACKAIYDVVMFFVERGSQIIALVNAVVDSVGAIADGAIGVAASAVENALSKALPVVISFLAALLGVTGITEKIRAVIAKVQAPVHKAIDWLINKAVGLVKAAGKFLGFGKTDKDTDADPEHDKKVQAGLNKLHQDEAMHSKDGKITLANARKVASDVKTLHPIFKSISVIDGGNNWKYHYVASPSEDEKSNLGKASDDDKMIRRPDITVDEKIDAKNVYWTVNVNAKVGDRRVLLGKGTMVIAEPKEYIFTSEPDAEKYEFEQEGMSVKEIARKIAQDVYEKAKKTSPSDISQEINRSDILVKGPKISGNQLEINLYAKVMDREVWWGDATVNIDTETGQLLLDTKNKVVYAQKIGQLKIRGGPGFTEVAQDEMNKAWEIYAKKGSLKKIEASLSVDNKTKFQNEFIRLKMANPSVDDQQIAQQAIHATPLARGRKAQKFTKIEVIKMDDFNVQSGIRVPNIIHVLSEKE
jgi:Domain of unknown function (DUF4157)